MKRIMCVVAYDGSDFFGYQVQPNKRTVQLEIEKALAKIAKQPIKTYASGRTDAGVHALGQVFHFDSPLEMAAELYKKAFNALLPADVRIISSREISSYKHARFHATKKTYHYKFSVGEHDPLTRNYIYYHPHALDFDAIQKALSHLVGTHDFTSFTSNKQTPDKVRTLFEATLAKEDDVYLFKFTGSGFMKYMVRIMVGTLIKVGSGRLDPDDIPAIINAKDRKVAGPTANPEGLYLVRVEYDL